MTLLTLCLALVALLAWTGVAVLLAALYALAGYRWRTPAATTRDTLARVGSPH